MYRYCVCDIDIMIHMHCRILYIYIIQTSFDWIGTFKILVPGYWPSSVWVGHGGLKSFSPRARFGKATMDWCCRTWFTCFPLLSSNYSIKYRTNMINQELVQLLVLNFDNFRTLINRTQHWEHQGSNSVHLAR